MKKTCLLVICLSLLGCIDKPDLDLTEIENSIMDLRVPDGFNYETTTKSMIIWKVDGLASSEVLRAEVYSDNELQAVKLISLEDHSMDLDIPLHKESIEIILYTNEGELISKTFTKADQITFRHTLGADSSISGVKSAVNKKGKKNDSDGDGVKDDKDWEPLNPLVSQATFIPALKTFNTIGFEDTWPANGDYDYNDLVVSFNLNKYMDKANKLSRVETDFKLLAVGAGYDNDFCYSIEIPKNDVQVSVSNSNLAYEIHGDDTYTEIRFPSVKSAFGTNNFVNTVESEEFYEWIYFTVTIEMNEDKRVNGTSLPYDFFIRINGDEGREVHMAGKHPTGKVNRTYFGTGDDDSQISNGKLYLNDRNLPWAVMIPEVWEYPAERNDILSAYPDFADFAQTNEHFPWYSEYHNGKIVRSKLYKKK